MRTLLRIGVSRTRTAPWLAVILAGVLGIGTAVAAFGALSSLASADTGGGDVSQLHADLVELNNKLSRAIKSLDGNQDAVVSDPAHWTRTLNDLEQTKLTAVGQFPDVFGLPYIETFANLSCIDNDIAVGKILMFELERGRLTHIGEAAAGLILLSRLKDAKVCKDTLEAEIETSVPAGASDDLRELNNKLSRAINQLEGNQDAVVSDPAHWTRTLNDLEATKLAAVAQFPAVFGLPYIETFTALSYIDEQIAVGKILMFELERGRLTHIGKAAAGLILLSRLKTAKEYKDALEVAVPGSTTLTTTVGPPTIVSGGN